MLCPVYTFSFISPPTQQENKWSPDYKWSPDNIISLAIHSWCTIKAYCFERKLSKWPLPQPVSITFTSAHPRMVQSINPKIQSTIRPPTTWRKKWPSGLQTQNKSLFTNHILIFYNGYLKSEAKCGSSLPRSHKPITLFGQGILYNVFRYSLYISNWHFPCLNILM